MVEKPFIIDTKDERCRFLADSLREKGYMVQESRELACPYIYIMSPKTIIDTEVVESINKGSVVVGGRIRDEALDLLKDRGVGYYNILEDEEFTVKNTVPTALGCIHKMIEISDMCINELKILILGYGRVGKTLTKYLKGLDVSVWVYSTEDKEKALAEIFANGTTDLSDICSFDVIINTIPAPILRDGSGIKPNAVVIDLASGNNVDIDGLCNRGIKAVKLGGLPGLISPKSAGKYMEEYILSLVEEDIMGTDAMKREGKQ